MEKLPRPKATLVPLATTNRLFDTKFITGGPPMTENNRVWQRLLIYPPACVAGFGIAWFDVAGPFGDDTEKGTILLWLLSSGIFGLVWPVRPWRWAMLIGLPVPAVHFALH